MEMQREGALQSVAGVLVVEEERSQATMGGG